jgi:cardiolipin synthase
MSVLTTANQLTLLRMLLIPIFVLLVLYGEGGWALIVFVVAGITDGLDGLIARLSNQRTSLGAWLDPMADKLLLVTTFIVLSMTGTGFANRIPIWLTVLVITRDVGIVLTVTIVNLAVGPRTFSPTLYGKVATATYILTVALILFFNYLGRHSVLVDIAIWTSLAATLVSGLHYFVHARRIINGPPASS